MIRPMERSDRDRALGLARRTGFFTEAEVAVAEELMDVYLDRPGQRDYDVIVVGTAAGAVEGFLIWGPTPLTEGTYDLYWMAVDPASQGRGHGTALVRWLEEKVRSLGGRLIVIETSSQPKYAPTRNFYLGLSYTEKARVPDFYKPGDDRVIYTKAFAQGA